MVAMKQLVCLECREPFEVPKARGMYPLTCKRPECEEAIAGRRRRAAGERKRARGVEAKKRAKHRALFDPIRRSNGAMLMVDELITVALLAADMPADKLTLRRAVTAVAQAKGSDGLRGALLRLAAVAIAWASAAKYTGNDARIGERDAA